MLKTLIKIFILSLTCIVTCNAAALPDSLVESLEGMPDSAQVNALNKLFRNTFRGDKEIALSYAEEALKVSQRIKYSQGTGEAYSNKGNYYLSKSRLPEAEQFFTLANKYFEEAGYTFGQAKALNGLGNVTERKGNYDQALGYYLQAYELFENLNNTKGLASVSNNIGTIYYLQAKPEKALNFYNASLRWKASLQDEYQIKQSLANIATIHFERWNLDSALYYFRQCLSIEKKLEDAEGLGKTYNSMGRIAMLKSDTDSALILLQLAFQNAEKAGDKQTLCSIYDNMGQCYKAMEKYDLAIDHFENALEFSIPLGLREESKNSYLHLAETYAAKKDFQGAYHFMKLYEELKSELLMQDNLVTETETLFLNQRHENEMLKLENEREIQKRQFITVLLILVIISISAFFLLIHFRNRQKSAYEKALSEQKELRFKAVIEAQEIERKRIASDLHDSVGQILAVTKMKVAELNEKLSDTLKTERKEVEDSLGLIDEAVTEVRNISHHLMPGALIRLGLPSAIRELVRKINSTSTMSIELQIDEKIARKKESVEIAYYRIAQELINNIIKHSQATTVKIQLKENEEELIMEISDNGIGLDVEEIKTSAGIGWKNIYSRISIINGQLEVYSNWHEGTTILVRSAK